MRSKAVHFNPSDERRYKNRSQCGEMLAKVNHSTNKAHTTCQRCLRSLGVKRPFVEDDLGPYQP